jgi:hypothetical protein
MGRNVTTCYLAFLSASSILNKFYLIQISYAYSRRSVRTNTKIKTLFFWIVTQVEMWMDVGNTENMLFVYSLSSEQFEQAGSVRAGRK